MYIIYAHLHAHTPAHSHTQTAYSTSCTHNFHSPLYIQWGATAMLSAACGGSVLVGKMLLKNFGNSLKSGQHECVH